MEKVKVQNPAAAQSTQKYTLVVKPRIGARYISTL